MTRFSDDDERDLALDDYRRDLADIARDELLAEGESSRERFGAGVCVTGVCVEPCGMDGGCAR